MIHNSIFYTKHLPNCYELDVLDDEFLYDKDGQIDNRKLMRAYIWKATEFATDTYYDAQHMRGEIINIVLQAPDGIAASLVTNDEYSGHSGVFTYLPIIYFNFSGKIIPAKVNFENSVFMVKSYDYVKAHVNLYEAGKHRTEFTDNNIQFFKIKSFVDLAEGSEPERVGKPDDYRVLMGYEKASASKSHLIPKYAHPENAAITWSGRGRKPVWFVDCLSQGGSAADLLIKKKAA